MENLKLYKFIMKLKGISIVDVKPSVIVVFKRSVRKNKYISDMTAFKKINRDWYLSERVLLTDEKEIRTYGNLTLIRSVKDNCIYYIMNHKTGNWGGCCSIDKINKTKANKIFGIK